MFRIGEFSKLTQVTIRMLRHYDEVGILKPAKIDPWTGYRMYAVEQIPVLNKIVYLRDSGFQVSEIIEALNQVDDALIVGQLDQKYKEIENRILKEQEKLRKIETAKKELLNNNGDMHYQITLKTIPSYQVLSLRRVIPSYYAEGALWKELAAYAEKHRIAVSNNTFSIYHDTEYKEEAVDVELCAPVTATGENTGDFTYRRTESVPIMACTMVYGDFTNISGAYLSFAKWLQENSQYTMTGQNRQIVHRGPWNEEDPEKYLVEIQIPLQEN